MTLEAMLLDGATDDAIGRCLRRTPEAVNIRRKRTGLPARTQTINSARVAAERLGFACAKKIARLAGDGLIAAHQGQRRGGNYQWFVTDEALYDYVANPEAWPTYRVEDIADRELRLWAAESRRERYLTTGEVAARYFVTHSAVHAWIQRGLLRAVRWGNWRVPESALVGFVPPTNRAKAGIPQRRFKAGEDAQLLSMVDSGHGWSAIAQQMGRAVSSVFGRYQRLQVSA